MNAQKRLIRAKAKAKFNRIERWRHGATRNPNRAKPRSGPLVVARGPGSINEASEMQRLVDSRKAEEAAAYYEACHRINYRAGDCQMRWGDVWYAHYKAGTGRAAA